MKKIVLAYSGGLDTSYCAKFLSVSGWEVHAVLVNTGGFTEDEIQNIKSKALQLGVSSFTCIQATQVFYSKIIKYLVYGNVLKNNTYPLSVSAERVVQAIEVASYAKSIKASAIGHGSTGAGNDQVRFDLIFQTLAPELEIVTPIRAQKLTRQDSIQYLKNHGVYLTWDKAKYSINKGIWGTSVGGEETLTSHKNLPEEAYPSPLTSLDSSSITLTFKKGEISGVNGEKMSPLKAIEKLQEMVSPYAIGRDIHVGDTIIGIKGRVGFEAGAPLVIIKAHHQLEKHILSKWQLQLKSQFSDWYGMLLHEGNYFDPVMRNIEAFLESSQSHVTGDVIINLFPYRYEIVGIESSYDLMKSDFGKYGEENEAWSADEAKGFIKILSNSSKIYQQINASKNV